MRHRLWIAVIAVAATFAGTAMPATADTVYPWCARLADWSGVSSCGFTTYEQCMAEVSGIGGFCSENPLAPKPKPRRPKKPRSRRR